MTNDESIFRNQAEILTKALKDREDELVRCGEAIFELRRLSESRLAAIDSLNSNIKEIESERDEARREVCEMLERDAGFSAQRQAESRGWDYLNEDGK